MIEKNGDQKCPSCRLVNVYAYYAQWRTVAVTPFCRTLTSGGAAAVDEKVRVDEEEKNAAGAAAGSTGRPPGTAAALKAAPIFPS